jgi:hypothetical protein
VDIPEIEIKIKNKSYYEDNFTIGPIIIKNFLPSKENNFCKHYLKIEEVNKKNKTGSGTILSNLPTVHSQMLRQNTQSSRLTSSNEKSKTNNDLINSNDNKFIKNLTPFQNIHYKFNPLCSSSDNDDKDSQISTNKSTQYNDFNEFLSNLSSISSEQNPLETKMVQEFINGLHKEISSLIVSLSDFLKFNHAHENTDPSPEKGNIRSYDEDAYHFQQKAMNKYLVFNIRTESLNMKFAKTLRNIKKVRSTPVIINF